jgi:hypothetical protein
MTDTTDPQTAVFVTMLGEFPTAVSATLEAAQQQALDGETMFQEPGKYEHRWDDKQRPGEVWRLLGRRAFPERRFSATGRTVHALAASNVQLQPASAPSVPADRAALSAKLWAVAEHHIVAEWICCEPLEPRHTLCAKGYAALGMARTLLVDGDPEKAWNPEAPLLNAVLAELAADAEAHRLALSETLGLGTGAPWDAIHERVKTLAAGERDEQQAQQGGAETRGPWGTVPGCACPHPADEHSIYGCADGCGCAWMPKRKPMDPVHILGVEAEPTPVAASTPRANETGGTVAEKRPRCPHCQMPHDLTPGSMGVRVCESIRRRIAEGVQRHGEGDHGMCCRADCDVLRQRDAAAPVAGQPPADTGEEAREETVHARPGPDDNGISPCCGRPPFEFRGERLTRDPAAVTCPTSPAVVAELGKEA